MKIKTLRFSHLFIISFCFIFSFFTSPLPAQTVSERDSLALVALYNSTNGDNWTRNDNWLEGPVSSWYGITVNDGRVEEIDLWSNKLSGNIPPEIGNLTHLKKLYLLDNQLTGKIPKELINLKEIEYLYLSSNQLEGTIPVELGSLSALKSLRLENNKLQGDIPVELANLSNLDRLFLHHNQLTGNIPHELGDLTHLQSLNLSFNKLQGSIPLELSKLVNLKTLNLFYNNLSGELPSELANLSQLQELYLSYNQFTGNFPQSFSTNSSLIYLYINDNMFTDIPDISQIQWETINGFQVYNNYLTFKDIIPNLANTDSLKFIYYPQKNFGKAEVIYIGAGKNYTIDFKIDTEITDNVYQWYKDGEEVATTNTSQLFLENPTFEHSGTYTCQVTNPHAPKLTLRSEPITLNVLLPDGRSVIEEDSLALVALYNSTHGDNWKKNDNWLIGPVYTWYGISINKNMVTNIYIHENNLDGTIPSEIGNLTHLTILDLTGNELKGNIPPEIGNLNKLFILNLIQNELTGSIPKELKNLNELFHLHLMGNQLNGQIPKEIGELSNLNILNLSYNQLEGEIPIELADLQNLYSIDLSGNKLSGSIPSELGSITNLGYITLIENKLSGTIPPELGTLINLDGLYLDDNNFHGRIPIELANLKNLSTLHLSKNQLSGAIPIELADLTNLHSLNLYSNQLEGTIPPELGNLPKIRSINLSNNQLTGTIPKELSKLFSLKSLSLASNQLNGAIPPELSKLEQLLVLNLSDNQISGLIPSELGNLQYLVSLNLSDNQLSGNLPPSIAQLHNLYTLKISNNDIQNIPDLTNINWRSQFYQGFQTENNQLTFEDILPNLSISDSATFIYSPQDSIGQTKTIPLEKGESYTIHLDIDSAITTNEYRWFKDSVEIAVTNQNSLTITDATPEDAGVYTCEVTNPAVDSLTLYSRPVTLIVKTEPIPQTITFDSIPDKTYGDKPFLLSATSDVGLEVLFEIIAGPATLSGDTLTITGAGEVTVKAFNEGDEIHESAAVERSFTVAKAEQTISFDVIPDKTLEDGSFEVFASASSGLAVNFSVEGPASLESTMLTLSDTGKVSITATQPGNENYLPAEAVIRTFVVKVATFNLSGKVTTEAGDPAGSGTVILYTPNEAGRLTTFATGVLQADGSYQFTDLKAGEYSVGVIPDDNDFLTTYLGNGVIRSEATLTSLMQNTENQNITLISKTEVLSGKATISGVLILEESNSGSRILVGTEAVEGTPLAGISVYLVNASGDVIASGITNAEGKFAFTHIPNGSYIFKADYEGMPHDTENFTLEVNDKNMEVTALVAKKGIVRVQEVSVITGTEDKAMQAPLLLYPNPTEGKFSILLDTDWLGGKLMIHTLSGQPVAQKEIHTAKLSLDLSHVKAGVYVITLQKGEAWQVMRVNKF